MKTGKAKQPKVINILENQAYERRYIYLKKQCEKLEQVIFFVNGNLEYFPIFSLVSLGLDQTVMTSMPNGGHKYKIVFNPPTMDYLCFH